MHKLGIIAAAMALSACGTFLPMAEESMASNALPYFTPATASLAPPIARVIGPVAGHSCKNLLTDPPATEQAALRQLQAQAATLGANGVVDVTFSRAGSSVGTNCWQSVTATGTAVIFEH